jgi:hypothetical protein
MDDLFEKTIQKLQSHSLHYFGIEGVTVQPIQQLQHRYSEVLKAEVLLPDSSGKRIYLKRVKLKVDSTEGRCDLQDRVKREYEAIRLVYDGFKGHPCFSRLKPIACFPEMFTVVTEECPGEVFLRLLEREGRFYRSSRRLERLVRYCHDVGRWLSIFQDFTRVNPEERFNIDSMIEYVDIRLKHLVESPPVSFNPVLREQIIRYFEFQKQAIESKDLALSGIMGDFCPANILVDEKGITVIDLAMYGRGSTLHDLSHFYQHLGYLLHKIIFTKEVVSRLQKALLDGYRNGFDETTPLFRLFQVQHILCRMVSSAKKWNNLPRIKQLFHRRVWRLHMDWLSRTCRT